MTPENRVTCLAILIQLRTAFQSSQKGSSLECELLQAMNEAITDVGNPKKEGMAVNFAVSRLYSKMNRIVGLHGISLNEETALYWNELKQFINKDIITDYIGGPVAGFL